MLTFGAHKGRTLREVRDADAGYLRWMCSTKANFGPEVVRVVEGALLHDVYPEPPPAGGRRR